MPKASTRGVPVTILPDMVGATIVLTALLVGYLGLRAEQQRRLREVWLCTLVSTILLGFTVVAHAAGQVG